MRSRWHAYRPRHLWFLFMAVTVIPAIALAWLGWQLVRQDAELQRQRVRDLLDRRAATVSSAVVHELAAIERDLPALVKTGGASVPSDNAVAVRLTTSGIAGHAGAPLLYWPPDLIRRSDAAGSVFAEAERFEFARHDSDAAIRAYRTLSASSDSDVRAGALVRLARAQRRLGRTDEALSTYDTAAMSNGGSVNGDPVDLFARWARIELLSALNRRDAAQAAAISLARDLRNGRWALERAAYFSYSGALAPWIAGSASDRTPAALSDAVATIWGEWRTRSTGRAGAGRRFVHLDEQDVLTVWREDGDGLLLFAATREYVMQAWSRFLVMPDAAVTLVDAEGHAVYGAGGSISGGSSVSVPGSDRNVPWTIQVTATSTPAEIAAAGDARRRVILAGLALLAFLLPASAYLVSRAVQREIAAARQQSRFVSAVSHEFRSPLTSLAHLTSLLRRDTQPTEERRRQYYDMIAHETERLRRFVETLLDFGRMEAGAARYRFAPLELRDFIARSAAEFQREASSRGHPVSCELPDATVSVSADAEALDRALWNLLENAAKYSPEGGSRIVVRLERRDRTVAVHVVDQGVGIPAAEQRHIFQQFYRGAQAWRSAVPGTGVGLAVVRHIVRSHGGEVAVQSEMAKGSTFTMTLPVLLHAPEVAIKSQSDSAEEVCL
jgi:signal transduction histidine kinase